MDMLPINRFAAAVFAVVLPLAACSEAGGQEGAKADTSDSTYLGTVSFNAGPGVSLGAADAPVTLVEYASLTCGHCKDFHEDVLPRVKADYVASGQVRYIFREYPTPPVELAIAGFATARCAGEDGYFDVLDDYFATQVEIFDSARAGTVRQTLIDLASRHGLSESDFEACLNDSDVRRAISRAVDTGQAEGVNSTPTLILNGERSNTPEARTADGMAALIDAALAG
ncbi:MAG: DsbA family protein, partial [Pseudomonadota bacterium]